MPEWHPAFRFCRVAGIRTICTRLDGPFFARLTFRVGRSDETLTTGGITHFVEHMALSGPPDGENLEHNGMVDATTTAFWASGKRDRVLEHLQQIAENLVRLPVERLETERSILLTEMDGWGRGTHVSLVSARYGATGPGLIGFPQFGLKVLTDRSLAAWSAERFTKNNAVLVINGDPPPASFDLPLPDGRALPPPAARPLACGFPAEEVDGPDGLVGAGMTARRNHAMAATCRILRERLVTALRHDAGISYDPSVAWLPLDAERAHLALLADARDPAGLATARDLMEEVCADLAQRGPSERELKLARRPFDDAVDRREVTESWAGYMAGQALFGMEVESLPAFRTAMGRVTGAQVRAHFAEAFAERLLMIPAGTRRSGLPVVEPPPSPQIGGRTYTASRRADRRAGYRIVAGAEGIRREPGDPGPSVAFASCAGVLAWRDGTRVLFDPAGNHIQVNPSWLRNGDAVIRLIDEHVPPALMVEMDREVVERSRMVEATLAPWLRKMSKLKRGIELLPEVLQAGETLRAAAAVQVGRTVGLLTVTDWRLIWIADDQHHLVLQQAEIASLTSRRGSPILGSDVRLTVGAENGARHVFQFCLADVVSFRLQRRRALRSLDDVVAAIEQGTAAGAVPPSPVPDPGTPVGV